MASYRYSNIVINSAGLLKFNEDNDLAIYSDASHSLMVAATNDDGALKMQAGTGGISFDATTGSGSTGSQNGAINLKSKAASQWENIASDLTLKTTDSGNLVFTAAGAVNMSAAANSSFNVAGGDLTLGTSTSGNLILESSEAAGLTAANDISLTSTGGAVNMEANAASQINVNSGNLVLKTTTTGDLELSAAGNTSVDATGSLTLGAGATSVAIGKTGGVTNILGDLVVAGNFTQQLMDVSLGDNIMLINNDAATGLPTVAGKDTGFFANRAVSDIAANDSAIDSNTTTLVGTTANTDGTIESSSLGATYAASVLAGDQSNLVGFIIKIASGPQSGQARVIASVGASPDFQFQPDTVWTPVSLAGVYTVDGTALTGTGTAFTSLSQGTNISVNGTVFVIESVADDENATVYNSGSATGSAQYLVPGVGVTVQLLARSYTGLVWQESTGKFVFANSTTNPTDNVTISKLLNVKLGELEAETFNISNTDEAVYGGGSFTSGAFTTMGGIGSGKNIIVETSAPTVPLLSLNQDATSSGQVNASLLQGDNSQAFFAFNGSSNDLTGTTNSIVNAVNNVNLTPEIKGFIKVNVNDSGSTNPLSDGAYFLPLYTVV